MLLPFHYRFFPFSRHPFPPIVLHYNCRWWMFFLPFSPTRTRVRAFLFLLSFLHFSGPETLQHRTLTFLSPNRQPSPQRCRFYFFQLSRMHARICTEYSYFPHIFPLRLCYNKTNSWGAFFSSFFHTPAASHQRKATFSPYIVVLKPQFSRAICNVKKDSSDSLSLLSFVSSCPLQNIYLNSIFSWEDFQLFSTFSPESCARIILSVGDAFFFLLTSPLT